MKEIYLLDCTLRDGGYVNNWEFGENNIYNIINLLSMSNVDFIELGFLVDKSVNKDLSLYNSILEAETYIKNNIISNYTLMISGGKYDVTELPDAKYTKIKNIRYIYKKKNTEAMKKDCSIIIDKGYNLFINPTYIREYSNFELKNTLDFVNNINPFCFSIVDSTGGLKPEELVSLFKTVHKNLNPETNICVHLHNNSSQAFKSAVEITKLKIKRKVIIDASIEGLGRGAGNLPIELIAFYMNRKFETSYDISNFKEVYKTYINDSTKKSFLGLSNAHYYSAKYNCHPNYANYLAGEKINDLNVLNTVFSKIPDNYKTDYNHELIKNILKTL